MFPTHMTCSIVPAARRGEVAVEDLPLPERQQAEPAYEELNTKWEAAVAAANKEGDKPPKLLKVRWEQQACVCGAGGGDSMAGSSGGEPYHSRRAPGARQGPCRQAPDPLYRLPAGCAQCRIQ